MDRTKHLGGSDIGVVVGLSKFATRYDLWLEKTGRKPSQPGNTATQAGHCLEPLILDTYCEHKGFGLERQVPFFHPDLEWASGTADGVYRAQNLGVDAKATCSLGAWKNGPPGTVVCQLNWYSWLSGITTWDIALLQASAGWQFEIHTIERNQELVEQLVEAGIAFWECVKNDEPPPPVTYEDIMKMFAEPSRNKIIADVQVIEWHERWEAVQEQMKILEKERKEIRTNVAHYMKDADLLIHPDDGRTMRRSVRGKYGRSIR